MDDWISLTKKDAGSRAMQHHLQIFETCWHLERKRRLSIKSKANVFQCVYNNVALLLRSENRCIHVCIIMVACTLFREWLYIWPFTGITLILRHKPLFDYKRLLSCKRNKTVMSFIIHYAFVAAMSSMTIEMMKVDLWLKLWQIQIFLELIHDGSYC